MSSLLTTMAILLANYDLERDYLSNFEPFVVDRLKEWPAGEEVRPKGLCEELSATYQLPAIPLNTVTQLRDRAKRDGYLIENSRKLYPNPAKLAGVPSLAAERTEFIGHFNDVAHAIRAYAKEVHDLDWNESATEAALERFVEEFSVELAMAKRTGSVSGGAALRPSEVLAVVHGFARRALERDRTRLGYLEEIVRASMLANVIYFRDLGSWQPRLDHLVAYLDTTVAFRALGLTDQEVSEAARQMLGLLQGFNVPVQVFDHTVVEMQGVLEGVQNNLRSLRTKGRPDLDRIAHQGQEVLGHALRQQWAPADLEEVIANLEARLGESKIAVSATPKYDPKLTLDEKRLGEILTTLGYRRESQRTKDIQSLSAIHFLREGRPYRDLGEARAIFVTSNDRVVRASEWWFKEQGKRSIVPQCISEISLTTQLWLRKPDERPEIARKFLIAESFAALNPGAALWERYLDRIAQRRERGDITDEDVKALVFSAEAKEGLIEVSHGDPENISDEAIMEVLARYEERVRAPLAEEMEKAQRGIESLQAQNEKLRSALTERDERLRDQGDSLASQNRELGAQHTLIDELKRAEDQRTRRETRTAARRALVRQIGSSIVAILVLAAAVVLWVSGTLGAAIARAGVGFAGACLAAGVISWGFGKGLKWAATAIITTGAFTALFFGLVSVANNDEPKPRGEQHQ